MMRNHYVCPLCYTNQNIVDFHFVRLVFGFRSHHNLTNQLLLFDCINCLLLSIAGIDLFVVVDVVDREMNEANRI